MRVFFIFLLFTMGSWLNAQDNSKHAFEDLDSHEKVEKNAEKLGLQKNLLMAEIFGGVDHLPNIVYITKEASAKKENFEKRIIKDLKEGKELYIQVTPVYERRSFVPEKIIIKITGDKEYSEEIKVW